MNYFFKLLGVIVLWQCQTAFGQTHEVDSLKKLLNIEQGNENKAEILKSLINLTSNIELSIAIDYARMEVAQ
jgi:hypothetical protein